MSTASNNSSESKRSLTKDFLASIVVFLVALPLCMGVAIASGVPVSAGLFTGIVAGIVAGSLAGCPLQVSGPAAGLAVIVYDIVQRFGLELLGVIVLLAGAIQIIAGSLGFGPWFRAVSPAVIKGMLAGIGVLIFVTQFHVMLDQQPSGKVVQDMIDIPRTLFKAFAQTGFAPEERRTFRTKHLKLVQELRTQQIEINEEVVKLLPETDGEQPDKVASELQEQITSQPELKQLANQQLVIADELLRLNAIVWEAEAPLETDQSRRIVDALTVVNDSMNKVVADLRSGDLLSAVQSQAETVRAFDDYLASLKSHGFAAQIGLLTIVTIVLWPLLIPKRLEVIPGPLVAIVLATVVTAMFSLPVVFVNAPANLLNEIRFPDWSVISETSWLSLFRAACFLATVASAETLLCATATDRMHSGPRTKYNKELIAQGVGNMTCGIAGALPMTGVIVRSTANIDAGGSSRWSAIFHGAWLLVFVVFLTPILGMIPVSALAAILVFIGYKLVSPDNVRELAQYGRGEVAIYFVTVISIVLIDLLTGILAGIFLATCRLLYRLSRLDVVLKVDNSDQHARLKLSGSATFLGLPRLASTLDEVPEGAELTVRFSNLETIDHACLDLLSNWSEQHETNGGTVVIDWKSLSEKYEQ